MSDFRVPVRLWNWCIFRNMDTRGARMPADRNALELLVTAIGVLFVSAIGTGALAQTRPVETGYKESVRVELVQLEVTLWPDSEEPEECGGFTTADFSVLVNGREREITAVDWLGTAEAMSAIERQIIAHPERPPLTLVLFFDLWHLNIFFQGYTCPMTKPMAFEQARRLVRDELMPGDRLLLVTFAGWPQVHEGWIRDKTHALSALDRLEVNPLVLAGRREHMHHQEWIAGMKSLFLALGRFPGRKDVFYFGDDFRFDDVALQMYEFAARAQANQVSVHAVDLLADCRALPGPSPSLDPHCPLEGGLACTDFRTPIALPFLSSNTGGRTFLHSSTLTTAVRAVRRMRGCRYLISFSVPESEAKRAPKAKVQLHRKGFRLDFPSSFGSLARKPTEREQGDALFLLPRFGVGLRAEVGLWPLRPSGKGKQWRGVIVARLGREAADPWPEELQGIRITAVAHRSSRIYGQFQDAISGEDLSRFRDQGASRLLVFPVDHIRPGLNTVVLQAKGMGGDIEANARAVLEVPEPPRLGEAGPWFIADSLARAGETVTVLPALDGILEPAGQALIVGFGCPREPAELGAGQLVALDAEATARIPIDWLNAPASPVQPGHCGWLVGRIMPPLGPGLWRFDPPDALASTGAKPRPSIEFRVAASDTP